MSSPCLIASYNVSVRISINSTARLSLTSAYWQEVSADRRCCTQARNAMMANAAAVLINNKSLLFDELQAVEDEDDDILMVINSTVRSGSTVNQHTRIQSCVEVTCKHYSLDEFKGHFRLSPTFLLTLPCVLPGTFS